MISFQAGDRRFESTRDRYTNVRRCEGLPSVLLQLKNFIDSICEENRREFFPGSGSPGISSYMTYAVESDVKLTSICGVYIYILISLQAIHVLQKQWYSVYCKIATLSIVCQTNYATLRDWRVYIV